MLLQMWPFTELYTGKPFHEVQLNEGYYFVKLLEFVWEIYIHKHHQTLANNNVN